MATGKGKSIGRGAVNKDRCAPYPAPRSDEELPTTQASDLVRATIEAEQVAARYPDEPAPPTAVDVDDSSISGALAAVMEIASDGPADPALTPLDITQPADVTQPATRGPPGPRIPVADPDAPEPVATKPFVLGLLHEFSNNLRTDFDSRVTALVGRLSDHTEARLGEHDEALGRLRSDVVSNSDAIVSQSVAHSQLEKRVELLEERLGGGGEVYRTGYP